MIKEQFKNNPTVADCNNPCNTQTQNSLYKQTNSFKAIDKFTAKSSAQLSRFDRMPQLKLPLEQSSNQTTDLKFGTTNGKNAGPCKLA